jgi:LPXTG-motif cell wall-anchored protein
LICQTASDGRLRWITAPSDSGTTTTVVTVPTTVAPSVSAAAGNCDPSYPDFCIPSPPPDLNCADILPQFSIHVLPPDPHGFDADHDGIGCESNAPSTTVASQVTPQVVAASNALPRTGDFTTKVAAMGALAFLVGVGCLGAARRRRSRAMP